MSFDLTDLIAYWRLSEASGNRVDAHSTFDLTDNGTVIQSEGRVGTPNEWMMPAAGFDGLAGNYLVHNDHASLSGGAGVSLTIAGWFRVANVSSDRPLVSHWNATGNQRSYILFFVNSTSSINFNVSSNGTAQTSVSRTVSNPANSWYFICAWHDATNNVIGVQVNNGTPGTVSYSSGLHDSTAQFSVGMYNAGSVRHAGRAAHVGFWKRVLTAGERETLWNWGMGLDYPFDNVSSIWDNIGTVVSNNARSNNFHNARRAGTYQVAQWQSGSTRHEAVTFWLIQPNSKLAIGKRTDNNAWTVFDMDGTGGKPDIVITDNDNHDITTVGIDRDGYIHVAYDMHGDNLSARYRTSSDPIDTWTGAMSATKGMLGTNESAVTYPTFFNDPDGTLYFMFRVGAAGNGSLYFYVYDELTETWAAAAGTGTNGLLINGEGTRNPYWSLPPAFDADFGSGGKMHIAWTWREQLGAGNNRDVYYTSWDGTGFEKADGSAQTVPITYSNGDRAHASPQQTGMGAFPDIDSDNAGRPHIAFKKLDGDNFEQVWYVYWTGSAWSTAIAITDYDAGFDAGVRDPTPAIAVDRTNNEAFIWVSGFGMPGLNMYRSTDYATWQKTQVLDVVVGLYTPTFHHHHWHDNRQFHLYLAPWWGSGDPVSPYTIHTLLYTPESAGGDNRVPRPGVLILGGAGMV